MPGLVYAAAGGRRLDSIWTPISGEGAVVALMKHDTEEFFLAVCPMRASKRQRGVDIYCGQTLKNKAPASLNGWQHWRPMYSIRFSGCWYMCLLMPTKVPGVGRLYCDKFETCHPPMTRRDFARHAAMHCFYASESMKYDRLYRVTLQDEYQMDHTVPDLRPLIGEGEFAWKPLGRSKLRAEWRIVQKSILGDRFRDAIMDGTVDRYQCECGDDGSDDHDDEAGHDVVPTTLVCDEPPLSDLDMDLPVDSQVMMPAESQPADDGGDFCIGQVRLRQASGFGFRKSVDLFGVCAHADLMRVFVPFWIPEDDDNLRNLSILEGVSRGVKDIWTPDFYRTASGLTITISMKHLCTDYDPSKSLEICDSEHVSRIGEMYDVMARLPDDWHWNDFKLWECIGVDVSGEIHFYDCDMASFKHASMHEPRGGHYPKGRNSWAMLKNNDTGSKWWTDGRNKRLRNGVLSAVKADPSWRAICPVESREVKPFDLTNRDHFIRFVSLMVTYMNA